MTFKEKMQEATEKRERVARGLPDPEGLVSYDNYYERWVVRTDLRAILREKTKKERGAKMALSRYLGICPQQLNSYLTGKQGLPYNKIEEVLWLLGFEATNE